MFKTIEITLEKDSIMNNIFVAFFMFIGIYIVGTMTMVVMRAPIALTGTLFAILLAIMIVVGLSLGYIDQKVKYFRYKISFDFMITNCIEE